MAMAAPVIVAEKLTLTGSIGVVTGIFIIMCCDVLSRLQTSLLN
jgi:ClpP class serine protease